jgi:hypothetical protein
MKIAISRLRANRFGSGWTPIKRSYTSVGRPNVRLWQLFLPTRLRPHFAFGCATGHVADPRVDRSAGPEDLLPVGGVYEQGRAARRIRNPAFARREVSRPFLAGPRISPRGRHPKFDCPVGLRRLRPAASRR